MPDFKLDLKTIAKMCNGSLSAGSNPDLILNYAVHDSRECKDNTLFIAIRGEHHDGHDYVATLLTNNSHCAALISAKYKLSIPNCIIVEDPVNALGALAHNYRLQFNLPLIAITGSNGKTTVKDMLKSICEKEFGASGVLATSGNFNSQIGMPLTLLRLNAKHKVAVIEMGMKCAGEIDYLTKIAKPTIAVVNNVMHAHAGFFPNLAGIAKAKGEIYNGLTPEGVACINETSEFANYWKDQVKDRKIVCYGIKDSICYLAHSRDNGEFTLATAKYGNIECKLQVLGEHNKYNAVTAATLALLIGCSSQSIVSGLAAYKGYKRRLEQKRAFNGALIIDDSYNANPDSVKAAILTIEKLPRPHWFVFADLKELGQFSDKLHEEIALFANEHSIDRLLTLGESTKLTNALFNGDKMHFTAKQDVVEYCKQNLPPDATLLIKGANMLNVGDIADNLTK